MTHLAAGDGKSKSQKSDEIGGRRNIRQQRIARPFCFWVRQKEKIERKRVNAAAAQSTAAVAALAAAAAVS